LWRGTQRRGAAGRWATAGRSWPVLSGYLGSAMGSDEKIGVRRERSIAIAMRILVVAVAFVLSGCGVVRA